MTLYKIEIMKQIIYICFLIGCLWGCTEPSENSNSESSTNDSELRVLQGSLKVIKLSGTPYEIGFQHGTLLKEDIKTLITLWKKDIEQNFKISSDEFVSRFMNSTDYISAIKKWTPELLEEIRGISEGSGIDFNTIYVFQLTDEMWTNGGVVLDRHHCSGFGVLKSYTTSKSNYIGQNLDVTPFYHKFKVLLEIYNKDSHNTTYIVTFPGFIGTNGINKKIGLTVNSLPDLTVSSSGLPVSCVVRGILNKQTFEQAETFINEVEHASGQNYIIGSFEAIGSFECSVNKVSVYWPDSTKHYTYHANNSLANDNYNTNYIQYLSDSLSPKEIAHRSKRFQSLRNRLSKSKALDLNMMMEVLSSKDDQNDPICNGYTWMATIMEFKNENSILYISPGKSDSTEYIKFNLQ